MLQQTGLRKNKDKHKLRTKSINTVATSPGVLR